MTAVAAGLGWAARRRVAAESAATVRVLKQTDLPLKGQIFHREAENRLSRRPREAKKTQFQMIFKMIFNDF